MIIKKQECQQEQPKRYAVEVLVKKIPNSQEVLFLSYYSSVSARYPHTMLFFKFILMFSYWKHFSLHTVWGVSSSNWPKFTKIYPFSLILHACLKYALISPENRKFWCIEIGHWYEMGSDKEKIFVPICSRHIAVPSLKCYKWGNMAHGNIFWKWCIKKLTQTFLK